MELLKKTNSNSDLDGNESLEMNDKDFKPKLFKTLSFLKNESNSIKEEEMELHHFEKLKDLLLKDENMENYIKNEDLVIEKIKQENEKMIFLIHSNHQEMFRRSLRESVIKNNYYIKSKLHNIKS